MYPTYQEVAAAVSAGKMPVILRYEHNSPVRHCFVFGWLSGGYIHFDNNSQYVEISNENVVETGYINDKNLAADYNPTATYSVGDKVMHKSKYYRCVTASSTPAGDWDSADWAETSVDEILGSIATALGTINAAIETVSHAGMYDLGNKTESDLNNGKLAIGAGNSTTKLTLTTVSTLTVLANSGVPNFALVIDNSGNSNNVTITVKDSTDTTTFLQSVSAGNVATAGKIYQLTCVGNCWTLAEFGTTNA